MPLGGDAFLINEEIVANTDTYIYQCQTVTGLQFELEIAQLYLASTDLSDYTDGELAIYAAASDNSLGVVGVFRTDNAEFVFAGLILQTDHINARLNELVVLSEFSQEDYDFLIESGDLYGADYYANLALPEAAPPTGAGGPVTGYNSCVARARIVFNGDLLGNQIVYAAGLAALVLGTAIAAAVCLSSITVPVIGWFISGSCALKAAGEAAFGLAALLGYLALQNGLAANAFNTAKQLCCFDWPETCPPTPV